MMHHLKIDDYELSSNQYMQQGKLVGAYANAVQDAAKNENGAANGFMGIGVMNMATGGVMGAATQGPWQNTQNNNQNQQETHQTNNTAKQEINQIQIMNGYAQNVTIQEMETSV